MSRSRATKGGRRDCREPSPRWSRPALQATKACPCITVAVFRSVTALQLSVAAWLRRDGYMVSPPSGRRGSGGEGCQAGAVVVPAGAGLVAPPPC